MSKIKNSGTASAVIVEPEHLEHPGAVKNAPRETVDPASEMDYWHVNYMTRPYYKEGRSFGDYEAAYRYGLEYATMPEEMTFEAAEKAHLTGGWTAARGNSPLSWEDVREATRDAWTRARRKRTV